MERISQDRLWPMLKARVEEACSGKGNPRGADSATHAKITLLLIGVALLYSAVLLLPVGITWLSAWALLGVTIFFLIVNAAHDASHGVLYKRPWANRLILQGSFALLGIDGELWGLRHRVAHHPHTNVVSMDPDSVPNPFLRLSPHHPWRPWFRLQHLYAPWLYSLAFAHTALIQDFEHLLLKPLPYVSKIRSFQAAWSRMLLVKLAYLVLFVVAPLIIGAHSLSYIALGICTQLVSASLVFVLTICLNHYVMETAFYDGSGKPAEEGHLLHQLRSSADWHATSKFCCFIMGGANAHTAHHLFPGYAHCHYHRVSRVIQQFCEEHRLPYNSFTFSGGLRSHFRFLKTLGRRPS